MHIVMLCWEYPPRSVGGLSEHMYHLAANLAAEGLSVSCVTAGTPESPTVADERGVAVYRAWPKPPDPPDFISWVLSLNVELVSLAELDLSQRPAEGEPVVLHAHDWLVLPAARALKHRHRLPLVATVHATEAGRHHGIHTREQQYIHEAEWNLTYEAWRVICCSQFMSQQVRSEFSVPADKIRIIPNGVARKPPVSVDLNVRRRFALDHEPIVFFIGRLVPEKGATVLVAAARRILAQRPDAKIVIAGAGPARGDIERLIADLGLQHKVLLAGRISDELRQQLLSWAQVVVVPSLYEPFGIVPLEAMAAKTPVVASGTGGLAQTVTDGINGLVVTPGSAVSLAEAVVQLLSDGDLRARLVRASERTVAEHDWRRVATLTAAVYGEATKDAALRQWQSGVTTVIRRHRRRKEA